MIDKSNAEQIVSGSAKVCSHDRIRACFASSVAFLLLLTAVAKLLGLAQARPFLSHPDPLFYFLTIRASTILAIFFELIVALVVFGFRYHLSAMIASSWLTTAFLLYRMFAHALFISDPCRCLGGILDWTKLSPYVLDLIPILILFYTAIGSLVFLILPYSKFSNKSCR